MKTHLLVAIRHVRERERKAMEQRGATSWLLQNVTLWRRYQYLTFMPLSIRRMTGFYARSNGIATSKGEMTRSALSDAGIDESFLNPSVNPKSSQRLRKAVRMLTRIPISAKLALQFRGRLKRSANDIGIICATILFQRMLERNPDLVPVINSDLSPAQVMLACAAQGIERRAVWWQDDFHYTEAVPFRVIAGVVLNRNGLGALQAQNPYAQVFKRNIGTHVPDRQAEIRMEITHQIRHAGVAVNGFFTGSEAEMEMLSQIRRAIGIKTLELRLHPTARCSQKTLPDGVRFSSQDESVEEFASRMDVVFSGNSAIQYKMVMEQKPVIHVPALDIFEFDRYKYVEKGLVFGAKEVDETLVERAFAFYRTKAFQDTIKAHEAEQFDIPGRPLVEIRTLLRQEVS